MSISANIHKHTEKKNKKTHFECSLHFLITSLAVVNNYFIPVCIFNRKFRI